MNINLEGGMIRLGNTLRQIGNLGATARQGEETVQINEQEKLRLEKIALNRVVGRKDEDVATVGARFRRELSSLEEALNKAYTEAEVTPPPPPVYTREWKNSVGDQTITWERSAKWATGEVYEFHEGLQVEVQKFHFSKVHRHEFCTFAEVEFEGQPPYIGIAFTTRVKSGRRVLHAQKDTVTDVTTGNIPTLRVHIDWRNGIPHCRASHRDNINIIFLDPDGAHTVMLEVSVTSRAGHFWVAIQELWAGQIARTTNQKAEAIGLTALPLDGFAGLAVPVYPENNFPGADFLTNYRDAGPGVIRYACEQGFIAPLSKCCRPPEWNSGEKELPEAMTKNGWRTATVLWFNLVIGWGFVRLADGQNCFVHFNSIIDEGGRTLASKGEFPFLEPMQQVAIRYRQGDKGLQATAIRLL